MLAIDRRGGDGGASGDSARGSGTGFGRTRRASRGEIRANLGLGPRARGVVRGRGDVGVVLGEDLDEVHATHEVVVFRVHRDGAGVDGRDARLGGNVRVGMRFRATRRTVSRRARWCGKEMRS